MSISTSNREKLIREQTLFDSSTNDNLDETDISVCTLFSKLNKRKSVLMTKYKNKTSSYKKLLLNQSYQSNSSTDKSEHRSHNKKKFGLSHSQVIPPGLNIPAEID